MQGNSSRKNTEESKKQEGAIDEMGQVGKLDKVVEAREEEAGGRAEMAERAKATPRGPGEEEVFLRIYDLSRGMATVMSESILGFKLDGIWHTSIELFGNEYFFQSGLFYQRAGSTHYEPYVERVSLGRTDCSRDTLHEFIELSRSTWTPAAYHLFENNCNNFSDSLAVFLLEKGIPRHILELPEKVKASPFFKNFFGGQNM